MLSPAVVLAGQLLVVLAGAGAAAVVTARRVPGGWRVLGVGALAFVASQIVRIPLLVLLGAVAPSAAAAAAIISSGLFEETSRLVVLLTIGRRIRGWRDGVGFGVGHGVIEAVLVTGLAVVGALTLLAVGDAVIADAPPEMAAQVAAQIEAARSVRAVEGLAAVVERVGAVCVHVGLAMAVLRGVRAGGGSMWAWWGAAVAAHAAFNGAALAAVAFSGVWLAEATVVAAAVAAVLFTRRQRAHVPDVVDDGAVSGEAGE